MSGSVSASIQWWGRRLRAAYSRSAIEAGVNSDPMILSVSAAVDISAARRARKASRTTSLSRGSVSTREPEDLGGHHDHITARGDSGRQVRALPGDQADLAEEATSPVASDQLTVRAEHLDRPTEDHDPVVVVVGR